VLLSARRPHGGEIINLFGSPKLDP